MSSSLKTGQAKSAKKGIRTSGDAVVSPKNVHSHKEDSPLLEKPLFISEKIVFPYPKTDFLEEDLRSFDDMFNKQFPDCGQMLMKKGKVSDEEWQSPSFLQAIFYEHSHPKDKRGNKRAKKLGNKVVRFAFESMEVGDYEQYEMLEAHRSKIRQYLSEVSNQAYECSLKDLAEEAGAPVLSAAYRTDLRSYFSESVQQEYYAIEKKVVSQLREHYGTASDHAFTIDSDNFDLSILYECKNLFIRYLMKKDLPEEMKALVLGAYFHSYGGKEHKRATKAVHEILPAVQKEIYAKYFGGSYKEVITKSLRDHLYFRHEYLKAASDYNPPLTTEETTELDQFLQGKIKKVSEGLKIINENCHAAAYESLLGNDPDLCISWKLNSHMMEKACRLETVIERYLSEGNQPEELIHEVLIYLSDRHQATKGPEFHVVEKHLEEILEKAWEEIELKTDIRLKRIRELNDHICFVDEFRRLYQQVSSDELTKWFKKKKPMPKNAQQVMRIALKSVRQERGLPSAWKPNLSLVAKAADYFDATTEKYQQAYKYLIELISYVQAIDSETSSSLQLFCHYAKEALYTSIGSRMFPGDKALARATRFEEEAMEQIIDEHTKRNTFKGLINAMNRCIPRKAGKWIAPASIASESSREWMVNALPKGVDQDIIDTAEAIIHVAEAGIWFNENIGRCMHYASQLLNRYLDDAGVNRSVRQVISLVSLYRLSLLTSVQYITRLLIKSGACLTGFNVESVTLKSEAITTVSQKTEITDTECETTETTSLFNLLMTQILQQQDNLIEGIANIYKIPKTVIAHFWSTTDTLNANGLLEGISSTSHPESHYLKRALQTVLKHPWSFINKQPLFDTIGHSIAHLSLLEMMANVENPNIKLNQSVLSPNELQFFANAEPNSIQRAIKLAILREEYFSHESLFDELEKKIVSHTG